LGDDMRICQSSAPVLPRLFFFFSLSHIGPLSHFVYSPLRLTITVLGHLPEHPTQPPNTLSRSTNSREQDNGEGEEEEEEDSLQPIGGAWLDADARVSSRNPVRQCFLLNLFKKQFLAHSFGLGRLVCLYLVTNSSWAVVMDCSMLSISVGLSIVSLLESILTSCLVSSFEEENG
jgi:hypothetical protein